MISGTSKISLNLGPINGQIWTRGPRIYGLSYTKRLHKILRWKRWPRKHEKWWTGKWPAWSGGRLWHADGVRIIRIVSNRARIVPWKTEQPWCFKKLTDTKTVRLRLHASVPTLPRVRPHQPKLCLNHLNQLLPVNHLSHKKTRIFKY